VEDTKSSTVSYLPERHSDSVLMEIQLRSLLEPFRNSDGWWIALLGTHTPGDTAIPQLNISVWPASIRSVIRSRLVQMGGVPLESPLQINRDKEGRLSVQQVKKVDTKSLATIAEHVTDTDDPA
jgi:hypothetical protein